jgi:hypothetical protein
VLSFLFHILSSARSIHSYEWTANCGLVTAGVIDNVSFEMKMRDKAIATVEPLRFARSLLNQSDRIFEKVSRMLLVL